MIAKYLEDTTLVYSQLHFLAIHCHASVLDNSSSLIFINTFNFSYHELSAPSAIFAPHDSDHVVYIFIWDLEKGTLPDPWNIKLIWYGLNSVTKNREFPIPLETSSIHPEIITYCNTNQYTRVYHIHTRCTPNLVAGQDQKWILTCTENDWPPNWHYKSDTITSTEFCILYRGTDCDIQLTVVT